ncbi:hypothetical protein ACIBEJ_14485 [Nonomuraea sp. NPDC050790]|uniref:hypothetical protein n=1 Tax=Nonomuraea sp. NPDC050790 TaxID=3364371 RepID=UPI00378E2130
MPEKSHTTRPVRLRVLLVLILAVGCGNAGNEEISRASLRAEVQRNPGVPFALPKTLPSGYRLTSAETTVKDDEGRVTVRQAYFDSDRRETGGSLVEVCMEEPGKPDQCGPAKGIIHHLDDVDIVLSLHSGSEHDSDAWRQAVFTTNLSEVAWLR